VNHISRIAVAIRGKLEAKGIFCSYSRFQVVFLVVTMFENYPEQVFKVT
jgi:hypothetical protein